MFSPLTFDVDLTAEMNGTLLEKSSVSSKQVAKIYIPTLMQGIASGSPKSTLEKSNGLSVFKNTAGRPSISKSIIESQNYLESNISGNMDSANVESAVNMISQNITKWVDSKYAHTGTVSVSYTVDKDSPVRCKFLNGKISKLSYSLNSNGTKPKTSI